MEEYPEGWTDSLSHSFPHHVQAQTVCQCCSTLHRFVFLWAFDGQENSQHVDPLKGQSTIQCCWVQGIPL